MCHGDISIVTFDWVEHELNPFPNFNIERECRNWESLLQWTKAHQTNTTGLKNPYLQNQ